MSGPVRLRLNLRHPFIILAYTRVACVYETDCDQPKAIRWLAASRHLTAPIMHATPLYLSS